MCFARATPSIPTARSTARRTTSSSVSGSASAAASAPAGRQRSITSHCRSIPIRPAIPIRPCIQSRSNRRAMFWREETSSVQWPHSHAASE